MFDAVRRWESGVVVVERGAWDWRLVGKQKDILEGRDGEKNLERKKKTWLASRAREFAGKKKERRKLELKIM